MLAEQRFSEIETTRTIVTISLSSKSIPQIEEGKLWKTVPLFGALTDSKLRECATSWTTFFRGSFGFI
jgi:hypothetical protein